MKVYIDWEEREVITEKQYEQKFNEAIENNLTDNYMEGFDFQNFCKGGLKEKGISGYDLLILEEAERKFLLEELKTEYKELVTKVINEDMCCIWEECNLDD